MIITFDARIQYGSKLNPRHRRVLARSFAGRKRLGLIIFIFYFLYRYISSAPDDNNWDVI